MKLAQLAEKLGCEFEGDPEIEITGVAGLSEAAPGDLTFLANPRYRPAIRKTRASAIVVSLSAGEMPLPAIRSADPYYAFARAIELFHPAPRFVPGVHPTAVIAGSAQIAPGAHIGPYCFVDEDVRIGSNAVLHSFVTIYRGATIGDNFFAHSHTVVRENCRIGHRVLLQNGAVVGADGFGFARDGARGWHKIVQSGITRLADRVEVQANSCVDRASIGETAIGADTKIDNLVQVGHGSSIGEHTMLCSQVGVGGSSQVGSNVILAGQVGVAGHLRIGDGAVATAQSGIPNDVAAGATVSGTPAIENRQWLRAVAVFNKLPELVRTLRKLDREPE